MLELYAAGVVVVCGLLGWAYKNLSKRLDTQSTLIATHSQSLAKKLNRDEIKELVTDNLKTYDIAILGITQRLDSVDNRLTSIDEKLDNLLRIVYSGKAKL